MSMSPGHCWTCRTVRNRRCPGRVRAVGGTGREENARELVDLVGVFDQRGKCLERKTAFAARRVVEGESLIICRTGTCLNHDAPEG